MWVIGCLLGKDATKFKCEKDLSLPDKIEAFRSELHLFLVEKLACDNPSIARGLIDQIDFDEDIEKGPPPKFNPDSCKPNPESSRFGLAKQLNMMLSKSECKGLSFLPVDYKKKIDSCTNIEESRLAKVALSRREKDDSGANSSSVELAQEWKPKKP